MHNEITQKLRDKKPVNSFVIIINRRNNKIKRKKSP